MFILMLHGCPATFDRSLVKVMEVKAKGTKMGMIEIEFESIE